MKRIPLILLVLFGCKQPAPPDITEQYVTKIISTLASDEMHGRLASSPEDIKRAGDFIASQFREIGLDQYDSLTDYRQPFDGQNNIVGVIKGKSKPNEFVIFSAHYDHIGIRTPVAGDSIANGADDDASGCTAVIALAKHFKALNDNARTLIFVTFTAEEVGGAGSKYFSEHIDPAKVVAMFNIEMIGKPSKWGQNSAFITGFDRSDFGAILQKNVQGTEFKFMPDPYIEQQLFYRSDNARLALLGVPAHSISTDQIDTDQLYHSVDDEVSTLDMKNIVAAIKAIAVGGRTIVSGKDTPTRIKPAGDLK
jgi:Zn-dependent M28 family amino/carboxypeptidase